MFDFDLAEKAFFCLSARVVATKPISRWAGRCSNRISTALSGFCYFMRSIERRFNKIVAGNPYWSSFICFAEAVKDQRFTKSMIARRFNQLVDKEDYERTDKREILRQLVELSNAKREREDDKK